MHKNTSYAMENKHSEKVDFRDNFVVSLKSLRQSTCWPRVLSEKARLISNLKNPNSKIKKKSGENDSLQFSLQISVQMKENVSEFSQFWSTEVIFGLL